MTFGERLRQLRKQNKLTQVQLAHEVHTDQQMISYYERDEKHPMPDTVNQLAKVLKTTSDYLLGLSDDPIPLTDDERELIFAFRRGDMKRVNAIMLKQARKHMGKKPEVSGV